jgi:hypothetical protein
VALVRYTLPSGGELLESGELDIHETADWCESHMGDVDVVVVERFIINHSTISNSQSPWSLETIGVVRVLAQRADVPFEMQSAAEGKSVVDNSMLHRLELWHKGGKGHANDAIRHTAAFMIRRGWRDPRMLPQE